MRAAILQRSISSGTDLTGASLFRWIKTNRRHCEAKERRNSSSSTGNPKNSLRRVRSETDTILSVSWSSIGEKWPPSPPALLAAVEATDLNAWEWKGVSTKAAMVKESEEIEYSGGSGKGKGSKNRGGSFGEGGNGENKGNRMIEKYYQDILREDPLNPLLLRNYGRFLHEVKRDFKKAEDYYGRAILACPGDGELLSLYARLIWDSQRDCERAEGYHERAVEASPDDCYVLGSYAHFLWDAEEGEEEGILCSSSPFLEAF